MVIQVFIRILRDKNFCDYKKMKYKYGEDFNAFLEAVKELYYSPLPLSDFDNNSIVFIDNTGHICLGSCLRWISHIGSTHNTKR